MVVAMNIRHAQIWDKSFFYQAAGHNSNINAAHDLGGIHEDQSGWKEVGRYKQP